MLSQKDADTQYIVVDPGSTDGSRDILADYADRIDVVVLEPDEGPADGLNRGFARSTGDIGYFINSDDFLLPGAIAAMKAAWRSHPDAGLVLGRAWVIDADERPIRELRPSPVPRWYLERGLGTIVQQGMSFRMDLFRASGGFNKANRTCWDYELLADMVCHGASAVLIDAPIGIFRMSGENISSGATGAAHLVRYYADKQRIGESILCAGSKPYRPIEAPLRPMLQSLVEPRRSLVRLLDHFGLRALDKLYAADVKAGETTV